ncbi:unnamed protein product [Miscanthus lutarioriparius]|uniref:Uncharacterized protein n=1 Tax=Miscanthus lutarioriparius TaxID=422564 RepID=A0A811MNI1_9POAL|nr:unnamed protein product [Miscanthus lutarioriparius]
MAWYPGMPENGPASGSAAVITSLDMMAEATRLRTKAVLLVARARLPHVDITIGDMWFPDLLSRAKMVTFFEHGVGQAPPVAGRGALPREVAPPPCGMSHNLLIHLDLVEDWSPPRTRTPSSGKSGAPSSISSKSDEYPRIYNFDDWTPGVLDGLRVRPRADACHPLLRAHLPEDMTTTTKMGKQALNLLRRTRDSTSNGGGSRQRTRSPPPARQWNADVGDEASDGGGHGRQLVRDGHNSSRMRDPLRREDADWERRRSCSPVAKAQHGEVTMVADVEMDFGKGDLGSALLSRTLPRAETCTGDVWSALTRPLGDYDPMIEEALAACEAAMTRSLSFSLPRSPSMEEQRSPVYVANCRANWDKLVELNKEAATLGYGNVIHFGPRVQLIKAFETVGPNEPIGDEALAAFAKRFATPLSPEQIAAVRKLTSLDSGPVITVAAQLAAVEGAEAMEDGGA